MDAPEIGTAAGKSAKRGVTELIGRDAVRCDLTGEKTHKREVGFCTTNAGVDLNGGIIGLGMALAYPVLRKVCRQRAAGHPRDPGACITLHQAPLISREKARDTSHSRTIAAAPVTAAPPVTRSWRVGQDGAAGAWHIRPIGIPRFPATETTDDQSKND